MIDIHTHILPNVDDGSNSLELSIEMIKKEISCGVNTIVFTPHSKRNEVIDKQILIDKYNEFIGNTKDMDVKCYLGEEIYYTKDTLNNIKNNLYLTLNNSKYLLIEFNSSTEYDEMENIIYNIKLLGYEVIIAHIERYNIDLYKYIDLKKSVNPLIQINVEFAAKNKRLVKKLIKKNVIDYIASDCHSMDKRCPNLDKVAKLLKKYPNINKNIFE